MPEAITVCNDFGAFQEILKNMRKADDIIISTINSVIPTNSFRKDETAACRNLYETLDGGYRKRDSLIKDCITVTRDRLQDLKTVTDGNDLQLSKKIRQEQTKLKMLNVELTVEDLIQQRTLKVFNERCRIFYQPV